MSDKVQPIGEGVVVDGTTAQDLVTEFHQVVDKYASFLTNIEVIGALEMVKLDRFRIEAESHDDAG